MKAFLVGYAVGVAIAYAVATVPDMTPQDWQTVLFLFELLAGLSIIAAFWTWALSRAIEKIYQMTLFIYFGLMLSYHWPEPVVVQSLDSEKPTKAKEKPRRCRSGTVHSGELLPAKKG